MKPITLSERKKIVEAKERGETIDNIIKWFKVSKTTIYSIWNQYRKTGSYEPKPFPGKQSSFTDEMNNKIIKKIQEQPDITQQELIDELGLEISQPGLSKHLKKLGYTLKKRRSMLVEKDEKTLLKNEKNGKQSKKI